MIFLDHNMNYNSTGHIAPVYVIEHWNNKSGLTHRLDGPAITYSDGTRAWYLWGILYSIEDFILKLQEMGYEKEAEALLWQI